MLQCKKMQEAIVEKCIVLCRRGGIALIMSLALLVGACESIPDAVNPLAWFEDDEKEEPPAAQAANSAYPKLGTVPKRPPSLEAQQTKIAQGLSADVENARYSNEKLQREVARRAAGPRASGVPRAVPAPRPIPAAPRVRPPSPQQATLRPVPPPPVRRAVPAVPATRTLPSQTAVAPRTERPAALPPPAAPVAQARTSPPPLPRPIAPAPVPALRPPPTQPATSAIPRGQTFKVATIYFLDGSTKLQRDDQVILSEIAAAQRQSGNSIRVVGHASGRVRTFDASRRHLINYQVSLDRAHAVAAALLGMGVPVGKLQVEGKGDTAPIYAEYSASGEAANRRTELYFVN